jgi:hypothetical protein
MVTCEESTGLTVSINQIEVNVRLVSSSQERPGSWSDL